MVVKLTDIKHDLKMYWLGWRIQFKAATKQRGAFMLQVIGMIINNVGITVAWWFLFDRFGTINGWNGAELIGLQGANMVVFGTVVIFSHGFFELPRIIDRGAFDNFLTKPSSLLTQTAVASMEISALGDLILGAGLLIWYGVFIQASVVAVLLFFVALVVGIILMWCFVLLPFLLAFYMFDSDRVARSIAFFFLDQGIYPAGVLTGGLRVILLTVFPGLFVGAIPLDVLRGVGWEYVLIGLVVAATWLFITLKAFNRAVRRYESANLVGAR
jgi:ABC-2 type transport system permease protein